jgi:aromatic ring-opening dioxygenase catalytic subunit (LigB family)
MLGWFDDAPVDQQQMALRSFRAMREHLEAARPDVIIMVGNDHLLNWPLSNTPEYTVGIADWHSGPADWYQHWLAREQKFRVPGHPKLARHLVNGGARQGLQLAFIHADMQFDDSISVPLCYLNPEMKIPLIPVTMNCTVPPIPTPERAYGVGRSIRQLIAQFPGAERVALIGSGGLSHEPGGPRYFHLDPAFDAWFLERLADGDHERLLRECTLERMEEAGSGGTAELIAWFVVLSATRGGAQVLDYCASHAWRCACSWVIWPGLAG